MTLEIRNLFNYEICNNIIQKQFSLLINVKNSHFKNGVRNMYIAMNRFKITLGRENDFENIWKERDTHLENVPGFKKFNLIKGKKQDTFTLYASHSEWSSEEDFLNWTKSEAFRQAHKGAGQHSDIYLGHPQFEGFEVII